MGAGLIRQVHVVSGHGGDPAIAQVAQQRGSGLGVIVTRSVVAPRTRDVVQQRRRLDQAGVQVLVVLVEPRRQGAGDAGHGPRVGHHRQRAAPGTVSPPA
jgi:hypothetical protein